MSFESRNYTIFCFCMPFKKHYDAFFAFICLLKGVITLWKCVITPILCYNVFLMRCFAFYGVTTPFRMFLSIRPEFFY